MKHLSAMLETWVRSLGREDPLEKEMAWRIPWTEEPVRLQSVGSQRVGHDCVTLLTTARKAGSFPSSRPALEALPW